MKQLILLIEADDNFRSNLFDLLELENFNIISASDSYLGLQLVEQMQPDLILCELNMPFLNGFEVLQRLRDNLTTAKIPFIFITSETDISSPLDLGN